jgi:hypothetical protein
MFEFVLNKVAKRIKELEIWIPIFHLHIQSDERIRKTVLRTVTKEMMDTFQDKFKPGTTEQENRKR